NDRDPREAGRTLRDLTGKVVWRFRRWLHAPDRRRSVDIIRQSIPTHHWSDVAMVSAFRRLTRAAARTIHVSTRQGPRDSNRLINPDKWNSELVRAGRE